MAHSGAGQEGWREWVERGFERWGHRVYRHRWLALIACVSVTAGLVSALPRLTVDNSTESFLLPDEPAVVAYNAFRDEFGRDDRVIVAVATDEVFDLATLERLRALHRAIEAEVPHVSEVDSLLNARVTRGEHDELVVEDLLGDWPRDEADLARIRSRALAEPSYRNVFLSEDGLVTALTVEPETYSEATRRTELLGGFDDPAAGPDAEPVYLTAAEGHALVDGLYTVVERFEADGFRIHLAGALVMTHRIDEGMTQDFMLFLPTTLVLMSAVLAVLFRRVGGVVMPLMVVVLSLLATLGTMILLGIPGSTAVQILPVFLLTVGVCDAVHILALVYRGRMEGLGEEDAVARALGHSGLAVLLTSVTTAAGMSSFVAAEMAAVTHLGILAPIGIFLAFVYTLVLIPALIAIFPLPAPRLGGPARGQFPLEGFLVASGRFAVRHPVRVLVPATLLGVLAVLGALQIRFSHNGLTWFPEDDRVVRDFHVIDEALGGSVGVEVLVDTGEAGGIHEPALLEGMDRFATEAEFLPREPLFIGRTVSILDILKETHQALNENRPEMRRIPETREAVAQELLLFEGSGRDDAAELLDSEHQRARMNMRVPFGDALLYPPLIEDLHSLAERRLGGDAEVQLTGLMTLLAQIIDAVIRSMMRSYAVAITVITPLMMLLLGSLRRGLVSMVPNLFPIVAVLGVMGWLDVALDSTTMLIGAMVIGIAVDDTIHFMHKFHRYYEVSDDLEYAVIETLRTTGSALLFTSLVLASGFAIFALSDMTNIRIFGTLSAFAACVAFAADLLVAPALLALVEGRRSRRRLAARGGVDPAGVVGD